MHPEGHRSVLRPFSNQLEHTEKPHLGTETDWGKDMVINIPFGGEVKLQSVCVIGADNGRAPRRVKLWKNEVGVGIDIIEGKKCVQEIALEDQSLLEYPVKKS